jgi:protein-disulfide isomerase
MSRRRTGGGRTSAIARRDLHTHAAPRRTSLRSIVAVSLLATAVVVVLIWASLAWPERRQQTAETETVGKSKGSAAAPVVLEEWADFQCPACRQYALGPGRRLEETLLAEGKVRVVWRHMAFLGQESVWAAEASECAAEQGQFWAYHDKLFAEQAGENRGAFSKANLKRFAAELGLQPDAFNACLDQGRYTEQVRAEREEGRRKGVRATPTIFINGQKVFEGVPSFEQLRQAIEATTATR